MEKRSEELADLATIPAIDPEKPRAVCEAFRRCCCGFSRRCRDFPTRICPGKPAGPAEVLLCRPCWIRTKSGGSATRSGAGAPVGVGGDLQARVQRQLLHH